NGRNGGAGKQYARSALVVGEIALSTVLLSGAVLLMVSISRLWDVSPGFDPAGVTIVQTSLPGGKFSTTQAISQFEARVANELNRLPGVSAVTVASSTPLERGLNGGAYIRRDGQPLTQLYTEARVISTGYFSTLGIPVLRGRPIDERDVGGT